MSGHVGEATASPSPPEGFDARQERYWLIERRCKDLCLYLDVLTRNMPRYEKYVLSAKMREIGYLAGVLWRANPEQRPEIYGWVCRHRHNR